MSAKGIEQQQYEGQRQQALKQFLLFSVIGLLNTAVDFLVYGLLLWCGLHFIASQFVAYAAGMVNSYTLNSWLTFRKTSEQRQSARFDRSKAIRFVLLNIVVLGISMLLLYVLVDRLSMNPIWAKLVVTCITVVLNFVGSKRWVFRM